MAKDWFVKQGEKIYGPFNSARLHAMATEGRILQDTEVGHTANGPWHPYANVDRLDDTEADLPPIVGNTSKSTSQERELWQGTSSQLVNLGPYLLCLLVIPIPWAIWRYIVTKTTRFELTSQRFRQSSGVFTKQLDELELYRVKDTTFTQTFFQRMFGLATIGMITSDSTTPEVTIESIPFKQAKEVREMLRSAVEEVRERKRVREVDYT